MSTVVGKKNFSSIIDIVDFSSNSSYPQRPTSRDHGISDWYCMTSATITYAALYDNTNIYQNASGVITVVANITSAPSRGTFSATAGNIYYADKAVNFIGDGEHHSLVPMTMAGTSFGFYASRNVTPGTIYVYCPYDSATVNYYANGANGINTVPATTTINLTNKQSSSAITYTATGWHYISSTAPILVSITGDSLVDRTPLNPAESVFYNRYLGYANTVANDGALTNNASVSYSTGLSPVFTQTIADGSGSATASGLGKSYLCDTYAFGTYLSDYTLVIPNTAIVNVSYWNGTSWVQFEAHVGNGSELAPTVVSRDGTNGANVAATTISGAAPFIGTTPTLWKWEGTDVFYLGLNDPADDEISMYGWMKNRIVRRIDNQNTTAYEALNGTAVNIVSNAIQVYDSSGTALSFNGTSQYVNIGSAITDTQLNSSSWTASFWVYFNTVSKGTDNSIITHGSGTANNGLHLVERNSKPYFGFYANDLIGNTTLQANQWYFLTYSYDFLTKAKYIYVNGVFDISGGTVGYSGTGSNVLLGRGLVSSHFLNGKIASFRFYSKRLSAAEIYEDFTTSRSRFGV